MMRTLWNVVSFLAVVHLLALALFVGWLWRSDRLSMDRVEQIRSMLSTTLSEEASQQRQAEREAEQQQQEQAEAERREHPPLPAAQQVSAVNLMREQQQRAVDRLEDEKQLLLAQLERIRDQHEATKREFEQQKQQWYDSIDEERQRKADEQFQQTLKLYEQIPSRQARDMLLALVDDGDMNQAVAYIDAMNSRAAAKIIREFKTAPQVELAKELLEELRTFGVLDADSQDESDERTIASAENGPEQAQP